MDKLKAQLKTLNKKASTVKWCAAYISDTGCTKPSCPFPHHEREQVEEIKRAAKAMAAMEKAKKTDGNAQKRTKSSTD